MDWVKQLYDETKKSWKENEEDAKGGFAIFYSPVKINPTIALIGYNPGGDDKDFNEQNISIPLQHEYFTENYKIATNVKKIFSVANLTSELKSSVKFNLIFFRSKIAKEIKNKELIRFSENKVVDILNKLQPKYIVAEGFATYQRLKTLLKATEKEIKRENDKAIIKIAETQDNIPLIGIIHPSGAWGVTTQILTKIGEHFKDTINVRN